MTHTYTRIQLAGPLWTVADVKGLQLRITDAAQDADVQEKLDAAEDLVLAYLGDAVDPSWTPATAPKQVTHAILMLTALYYEHRGDTEAPNIPMKLAQWLSFYRDGGLA